MKYARLSFFSLAFLLCLPAAAFAASTLDQWCGSNVGWRPDWNQITTKLSSCMIGNIYGATLQIISQLSAYMMPIVSAMLVLAIARFGMQMLGGKATSWHHGVSVLLRFGLVIWFITNATALATGIFRVEEHLIVLVSGSIGGGGLGSFFAWIDQSILGRIIGFGHVSTGQNMQRGLMGLIGAAMLSSTVGTMLFVAGISAIINVLLFVFRLMFIYILSFAAIGFLLAISIFIVPMALFLYTERYFIKWLDTLFATMLVPILIAGTMWLFIPFFIEMVENIFYSICQGSCHYAPQNTDFSPYWKSNQPQFSWMIPSDPNMAARLQKASGENNVGTPAVQTFINPAARRAHDASSFSTPGIDFGPNNISIMQKVIFAFIQLWIYTSFLKTLINQIPNIADNIANARSGITMRPSNMEQSVRQGWQKMQSRLTKGALG